ncbi:hypothetical protein ACFOU2_07935 [Bacillus songklensis]|uniref:Uncharacterized protein n=1 Tax=Bacillus songklensis TaxID=1069116 RepID=A0ABV8AZQ3_9BACI
MNFLRRLIAKQKVNADYSFFLGCGRIMGRVKAANAETEKDYAVGNLFSLVKLNRKEYHIWLQLGDSKSMEAWLENCINKNLVRDIDELRIYRERFTREHILIDCVINDIGDDVLKQYTIVKNGVLAGFSDKYQQWIVNSCSPEGAGIGMSQEEYDMWRSSTGVSTMFSTINHFINIRNCGMEEAIITFLKYLHKFNKAGLWNIEYCGDYEEIYATEEKIKSTVNQEWFNKHGIKGDSQVIALGEQLGQKKNGLEVILGNQKITLDYEEFVVWLMCRKKGATILKISKMLDVTQEEVKEHVKNLLAKKMLMLWPEEWNGGENHLIAVTAIGTSTGLSSENNYKIKDLVIGKHQTLPEPVYFVWMYSHGFVPIGVTVKAVANTFNVSNREAEMIVSQSIPILLEYGLANIHLIPKRDYVKRKH